MTKKITFLITVFYVLLTVSFLNAADITITNSDITGTVDWTNDNVYTLDGFVFVEDGEILNIAAGTIVKALPGQTLNASALVVMRGGVINAIGNSDEPIIFTTSNDADLDMPSTIRGEWGGIIILGKGTHNNLTNDNEIEGVPADQLAYFGGDVENDNSGTLKFVSIRHGGTEIAPDEEINGLTLGAVGSGTVISHVEVTANLDDGIEFFGGAPKCDHLVVAFCGDDAYDYDEGFHGMGQFWLAVQTPGLGDNGGEHDGGPSSNRFGTPNSHPVISNASYIGRGDGGKRVLTLRDYAGGEYHNSLFVNQENGIRVEYVEGSKDSWYQLDTAQNIVIKNNVFYGVAGDDEASVFTVYNANDVAIPSGLETKMDSYFALWNNSIAVVDLGVSMTNPVPSSIDQVGSTDYTDLDDWFTKVNFKGAFDPAQSGHWAGGWSFTFASDTYNAEMTSLSTATEITKIDNKVSVFPNPVVDGTTFRIDFVNNKSFDFVLYNLNGKAVKKIENIKSSEFHLERDKLSTGLYIYELRGSNSLATGKLLFK